MGAFSEQTAKSMSQQVQNHMRNWCLQLGCDFSSLTDWNRPRMLQELLLERNGLDFLLVRIGVCFQGLQLVLDTYRSKWVGPQETSPFTIHSSQGLCNFSGNDIMWLQLYLMFPMFHLKGLQLAFLFSSKSRFFLQLTYNNTNNYWHWI